MSTNETTIKVSPEVQARREVEGRDNALRQAIRDAAEEKWCEENEFGGDVDAVARTVTVGDFGGAFDIRTTYRYGFDAEGNLHLWNEEDGEEPPADLADDAE